MLNELDFAYLKLGVFSPDADGVYSREYFTS